MSSWPSLGSHTPSYLKHPVGFTGQLYLTWKGTTSRCKHWEQEPLKTILEAGSLDSLPSLMNLQVKVTWIFQTSPAFALLVD